MKLQADILCASTVVGGILGLSLLSRMTSGPRASSHGAEVNKAAKELVSQALEWHKMCEQDDSVAYAMHHATLAAAYMNAARLLCSDDILQRATGIDVHDTQRALDASQRRKLSAVVKAGPQKAKRAAAAAPAAPTNWL